MPATRWAILPCIMLLAATENKNLEVVERLAQLGADKGAYDKDGITADGIVKSRVEANGRKLYLRISDSVDERVLAILRNL